MAPRRLGTALVIGTLVLAIAGTQWPFEYRLDRYALAQHWRRVDWSWWPRIRGFDRDLLVNLAMLGPLGAGFALARQARAGRVVVEALVLGLFTSIGLELAQLLTRERFTQLADVWRNGVGCAAGALVVVLLLSPDRLRGNTLRCCARPDR